MNRNNKIAFSKLRWMLFLQIVLQICAKGQQLNVVSMSPDFNEIASDNHPQIIVTFSQSVDTSSLTIINFSVSGERSGYHDGIILYDIDLNEASFLSSKNFISGERVKVSLARGIHTLSGDSLSGFAWEFRIPSINTGLNFDEPVSYGGGGYGMQCIDMNKDGSPDIVTSSGLILLNNGNGQFISSGFNV
jgi:hypothetical protein